MVPVLRSALSWRTVLGGVTGLTWLGLLALSGCTLALNEPTTFEAAATRAPARGGCLRIARSTTSASERQACSAGVRSDPAQHKDVLDPAPRAWSLLGHTPAPRRHDREEPPMAWSTHELAELAGTTVQSVRYYH